VRNSDRIVRTAITALQDAGSDVPLEEIARRAGVGIATLYRGFGDRDGLIRAAFETYFSEEVEPLVAGAIDADDPLRGLTEALTATVRSLSAHRALLEAAKESRSIKVDIAARFMDPLGEALAAAQRLGLVRADLLVRDLAAIVVMALATAHPRDPDSADLRRYLALLLDGIRPSPRPLPPPAAGRLIVPDDERPGRVPGRAAGPDGDADRVPPSPGET
jgi:AcrR family transcriptional regulator